jgi:hypothetical protein
MAKNLNEHYKKVSASMQIPLNVEENKIYVAYHAKTKLFYRVQVQKVKNNVVRKLLISCYVVKSK